MSSIPNPCEPAVDPAEKLGVAAGYLANQVTTKKADVIVSALGPKAVRSARVLRSAVRTMVHKAAVATGRSPDGKVESGGTSVEDERS